MAKRLCLDSTEGASSDSSSNSAGASSSFDSASVSSSASSSGRLHISMSMWLCNISATPTNALL